MQRNFRREGVRLILGDNLKFEHVFEAKFNPPIKTMSFGLDSISFRGSFLWNTLDDRIEREKALPCFQRRICKVTYKIC